mmetsp:Transcript_40976/g.96362  ORF Transcript_40976/g.96362 Transcript_40976/m.96362 type:complete len:268 (+) Transcript_40976:41-844(+)
MSGAGEAWEKDAEKVLNIAGSDPSGYVGRLTDSEQEALAYLREETEKVRKDHGLKDKDFLRFLRACGFDKAASLKMMLADLEWRAEAKPEEIKLEEVRGPFDNGTFLPKGNDKRGRPTLYYFTHLHDPKMSEIQSKLTLYTMETKCREVEDTEEETFTMVFDLTGYGLKNMDVNWCWTVISRLQNDFPERLGTCLILNAPSVFSILWNICRPWLAKRTTEKILWLDGDYKEKLKYFIAEDNIPELLGGSMAVTPQSYIVEILGPQVN